MQSVDDIIAASKVPHTNVFFLGCFERQITLFAQQIRALNLVDAILTENFVPERGRVAIVGGGAAGMTAAVAFAKAKPQLKAIDLYERKDRILHLQRDSDRYLHPHLYHWPSDGSTELNAGLPVLNWQANKASAVSTDIITEFYRVTRITQIIPQLGYEFEVIKVEPGKAGRWLIVLRGMSKEYDAVILSIGFGYEKGIENEQFDSYWTPSPLSGAVRKPGTEHKIFVSGNGDGGLVDFIMAAYAKGHQDICEFITKQNDLGDVKETLSEIEAPAWRESEDDFDIYGAYKDKVLPILPSGFQGKIAMKLRQHVHIWLHTRNQFLFRRDTSILNRFAALLAIAVGERDGPNRVEVHTGKRFKKKKRRMGDRCSSRRTAELSSPIIAS